MRRQNRGKLTELSILLVLLKDKHKVRLPLLILVERGFRISDFGYKISGFVMTSTKSVILLWSWRWKEVLGKIFCSSSCDPGGGKGGFRRRKLWWITFSAVCWFQKTNLNACKLWKEFQIQLSLTLILFHPSLLIFHHLYRYMGFRWKKESSWKGDGFRAFKRFFLKSVVESFPMWWWRRRVHLEKGWWVVPSSAHLILTI